MWCEIQNNLSHMQSALFYRAIPLLWTRQLCPGIVFFWSVDPCSNQNSYTNIFSKRIIVISHMICDISYNLDESKELLIKKTLKFSKIGLLDTIHWDLETLECVLLLTIVYCDETLVYCIQGIHWANQIFEKLATRWPNGDLIV